MRARLEWRALAKVRGAYFCEESAAKIRRTDVRPICSRRAISDLLPPARCSLRIATACTAAWTSAWAKVPRKRGPLDVLPRAWPAHAHFEQLAQLGELLG